jgi:hypothetical protein
VYPLVLVARQSLVDGTGTIGPAEWRVVVGSGEFRQALIHTAQIKGRRGGASNRTWWVSAVRGAAALRLLTG